jgi:hypothetical protein
VRQRHALILLALAGCSSPPPDCSPFVACGGAAAGSWHIAGTCNQPTTTSCGEALSVTQSFSGSLTLNDDSTYELDGTVGASGQKTVPAACLQPSVHDCALLDDDSNGVRTTCTGDPQSSCTCTIDEARGGASETGSWVVSGNTLTFAPLGDGTYGGAYCAGAKELRIQLTNQLGSFVEVLTR